MSKKTIVAICLSVSILTATTAFSTAADSRKLREFGNVDWESEMLFLDSLDNELRKQPDFVAYVIVYGGRRGDRHGETRARMACIKDYLLKRRGVSPDRIVVTKGGYREESTVELWLAARGDPAPVATPSVSPQNVRFKKGRIKNWRCRCNI